MEQTELLWQYQQADMAADAFETEIKRNPNRLQLKKNREFLVEQQNAVKRMEQEVAEMLDRVDVIKVAISRMEDQLSALQKRMEATPPADLKQAQDMSRDAQKLLSDLTDYEQEMKRIQKDASCLLYTSHAKTRFHHTPQKRLVRHRRRGLRAHIHAHKGAVHLRRRREAFRRHHLYQLRNGPVLASHAGQAVGGRGRRGQQLVRYLLLHHDGNLPDGQAAVPKQLQNGGGDVVGNVGDHKEPFPQRPADLGKVQPAHISLGDAQVVKGVGGRDVYKRQA